MSSPSIELVSCSLWDKVCAKVNKAVVFIDKPCAECLHWNGGMMRLVEAGAIDVKEFSSFESATPYQKKGVFIVSGLLTDVNAEIIHDIVTDSKFQYVVIITATSAQAHMYAKHGTWETEEEMVFGTFEEKVLEWMGNMNFTVEICHLPLTMANLCTSVFTTPQFSQMSPHLPCDLSSLKLTKTTKSDQKPIESLADLDLPHLPYELQLPVKMLVSSLNALFDKMGLREDCYSVGHLSKMIATELANFPLAGNRRKTAQNKASIVFVDRSLDIAGVAGHHGETLLDKILLVLPRLQDHTNDVQVDMAPLCAVKSHQSGNVLVPGCLSHADHESRHLLNSMFGAKHKEALMDVNRQLVEAASSEHLPLKLSGRPGRVTVEQLENHLQLFKGNSEAIQKHSGLLQLATATVQTLQSKELSKFDSLLATEKVILQNLGDPDCPSGVSQVLQIMEKDMELPENERQYSIEDILLLLVFIYSLVGEEAVQTMDEESEFKAKFIQYLKNCDPDKIPSSLSSIVTGNEHILKQNVDQMFTRLESLGSTREQFEHLDSIFHPGNMVTPASYKPLLKQIVDRIFDPSKPDLVDIQHMSSGFKDLLKSGFGLFVNVSKPRPSDHPLLIMFIVGGVTPGEIKLIKDSIASYKTGTQVIVGSTRLLKPSDVLETVTNSQCN